MLILTVAGAVALAVTVHWAIMKVGSVLRRRVDRSPEPQHRPPDLDSLLELAEVVAGAVHGAGGCGAIRALISVDSARAPSRTLEVVIDLDRSRPTVMPVANPVIEGRARDPATAPTSLIDSAFDALQVTGPPPGEQGQRSSISPGPTCAALVDRLSARLLDGTAATVTLGTVVAVTGGEDWRALVLTVTLNRSGLVHAAAAERPLRPRAGCGASGRSAEYFGAIAS